MLAGRDQARSDRGGGRTCPGRCGGRLRVRACAIARCRVCGVDRREGRAYWNDAMRGSADEHAHTLTTVRLPSQSSEPRPRLGRAVDAREPPASRLLLVVGAAAPPRPGCRCARASRLPPPRRRRRPPREDTRSGRVDVPPAEPRSAPELSSLGTPLQQATTSMPGKSESGRARAAVELSSARLVSSSRHRGIAAFEALRPLRPADAV